MFEFLSWVVSECPDATTDGGVVMMVLVFAAVMVPCTVAIGMLRYARRRQAQRMRAEHDRVMFRFRHI